MSLHQLVLEKTAQMLDVPDEKAGAEREGRTWTRKEELGHLIDSAMNNHNRIVRAALDGEYTGPGYDQDGWVDMNAYNEMGWVVIVFLWRDLNLQLSRVIDRVPQDWLSSPCTIGGKAPVTLGFLITDYREHMVGHLDRILR